MDALPVIAVVKARTNTDLPDSRFPRTRIRTSRDLSWASGRVGSFDAAGAPAARLRFLRRPPTGRSTCPKRKGSARATAGAMAAVVCHLPIQSKYDKEDVPVEDSKLGRESEALRTEIPELDKFTGPADAEAIQDEDEETGLSPGV